MSVNQRVQQPSKVVVNGNQKMETIMDAKWNNIIDRFSVRVALLAVAFGVWLAISYGVLAA